MRGRYGEWSVERFKAWLTSILFLDKSEYPDPRRWRLHCGVLITAAVMGVSGLVLAYLPLREGGGMFISMIGSLVMIGGLMLVLLEVVLSAQYGFPVPREVIRRGMWAKRRIITPVVAFGFHMVSLFSLETLLLIRDFRSPWPVRVAAFALLVLYALPFWFFVLAPVRWWTRDEEVIAEGEEEGEALEVVCEQA